MTSNFWYVESLHIETDDFDLHSLPDARPANIYKGQRWMKRTLDVVGAITCLILLWPVMVVIAIAIKMDSSGRVLFTQERVGENGRLFRIFKFRSMIDDAEAKLNQFIDIDKLPEPVFKIKNDPRVTTVGRFLRRTSLDELPQLFNVIRGEMSLVGPRPEEKRLVDRYTSYQRQRLQGLPGITGPMQINGRADLSLAERVQLEVDYLAAYSLWQDIKILLRTLIVVFTGRGAY